MSLTFERADVVTGILVVAAVVASIADGKVTNLCIGAAMVACHHWITRRNIFASFRSGQRSRDPVIDINERRVSRLPVGGSGERRRGLQ